MDELCDLCTGNPLCWFCDDLLWCCKRLSSYAFGRLSQYTEELPSFALDWIKLLKGIQPLTFIAALINLSCAIALLFWKPLQTNCLSSSCFLLFGAWQMLCGRQKPNALYGILFPKHKEAAFANYRMWESLGFVIAFAYSTFICLSTKIYILISVLALTC
ncbi:hypothetical protein P4O66_009208 [Electrophorus voltai]|uniref:Uncharacterized protein n=1 Tax=Electrophorus voltai TaxID=2609070 RepID=A0AAD8ZAL9_9TELE|nr:hypothetical protein P4O66_009208 [Electrophorus voltai]